MKTSAAKKLSTCESYRLEDCNGYIVADIEGSRCLIDTGSPSTVSPRKQLSMFGEKFGTIPTYGPMHLGDIEKGVGTRLDYLVGLNVLTKFPWELDVEEGWIAFYPDSLPTSITNRWHYMNCGSFMGMPVLKFNLNGRDYQGLFDTGAPLQYAPKDAELGKLFDYQKDFFPTVGEFLSSRYKVQFKVGNRIIDGMFGKFPPEIPLAAWNAWILGSDVLKSGPVAFDLQSRSVYLC